MDQLPCDVIKVIMLHCNYMTLGATCKKLQECFKTLLLNDQSYRQFWDLGSQYTYRLNKPYKVLKYSRVESTREIVSIGNNVKITFWQDYDNGIKRSVCYLYEGALTDRIVYNSKNKSKYIYNYRDNDN